MNSFSQNQITKARKLSTSSGVRHTAEADTGFLLPSDDQLDYFVDKLCESIPSLKVNFEAGNSEVEEPNVEFPGVNENVKKDEPKNKFTDKAEEGICNLKSRNRKSESNVVADGSDYDIVDVSHSDSKSAKPFCEKRSLSNNDLNIAIMQCSGSLELLSEKRKNLELLAQMQHNVTNINYNFSYSPRLPDSPTRVDRLMYDISRERCRILGLVSALDKTICSFSSKNTKDNLRKLLVSFGNAIVEVIKERQSEVTVQGTSTSNDYDAGVMKLVELIGRVHKMNRAVHSALWCIEIKEQVGLVSMRTRAGLRTPQFGELRSQKQIGIAIQKSWQYLKTTAAQSKKSPMPIQEFNSNNEKPVLQHPVWVTQQQTSVYQIIPQQKQNRRNTVELYTQEQRAEVFQHFYSFLKQSS